jgi:hypothetical protein
MVVYRRKLPSGAEHRADHSTTVSAEELARTLEDHFRAQSVRGTGLPHQREPHGDAGAQGKPWRQLLGVTSALTVVFTPGEGQLSIDLGVTSGLMRR